METTIQSQHKYPLLKKFLHTKLGARIGFALGISGYNAMTATVIRANGKVEHMRPSYNARVDIGAALNASLISGTTLGGLTSPLPAKFIALSTSSLTVAKGDTTLVGETVVSGLIRALGISGTYVAPSVLDGGASYVLTKTFTSGVTGPTVIVSAAIFDAVTTGNMFVEANLSSSVSLALNDQIIINWTVNL